MSKWAAKMAIFPTKNNQQRVATGWGLVRTFQKISEKLGVHSLRPSFLGLRTAEAKLFWWSPIYLDVPLEVMVKG